MNKSPQHLEKIQTFLEYVMNNSDKYQEVVLHEAAEGLGNLSQESTLALMERF